MQYATGLLNARRSVRWRDAFRRKGRKTWLSARLLLCGITLAAGAAKFGSAAELYVGAASTSITPRLPMPISGQMRTRIATVVESEVMATVLVLESRDAETRLDQAVFVACDLVGIRGGLREAVCARVEARLPEIDADKVILSATHTHTAPTMIEGRYHLPDKNVTRPKEFVEFAATRIAEAIAKAWKTRQPARVGWGVGHAVVAQNRRAVYADGRAVMYGRTDIDAFRGIEGHEDHAVEVLFFWDREDRLIATAVNIACPAQAVEARSTINADYWHPVREALKAKYGSNLHVLGWIGAAGDHVPRPMYRKKAEERMRRLRGLTMLEDIARRIVAAWEEAHHGAKQEKHADVVLRHRVETIELPLRKVTDAEYARVKQEVERYTKDPRDIWIKNWKQSVLDRYEQQHAGKAKPYRMELHTVRLGDIAIATNDFELFNDYGVQMKSRSPALQTFVVQLCGPGTYVPTPRAVRGGGYSAVIESSIVGPKGGQRLTDKTVAAIKSLFRTTQDASAKRQAVRQPTPKAEEPKPRRRSLAAIRVARAAQADDAQPAGRPDPPPMSPAESLAAIHVRDGYVVELVAAEPLVVDPVAIAWGADGRLWVAEMADYPLGLDGKGKPGGRVRVLEDSDGDGRYDRSTVFLEGIRFPTGVLPWRDGVLVTAAPEIFFARDTNGDGRADEREVLFVGFQEGNQQLRVNGLRWGLDGWVYCANGAHHAGYGASSRIRLVKQNRTVALGSRDFRFRPETGELEPQSGPSQFGRNRDDWGNWFGQQNSWPLWHFVLDDHYLRRNPHFAPPDPRKQLVVPNNPKVYPAKTPQKRFHSFEQSGRFTSACSAMIYRDSLLFPDGMGRVEHAFTCEPFHNLVQHNVIVEEGTSFTAHRDEDDGPLDFFASKDRWCRPVMACTGPDGALWIVDMYRYMIEHPEWLTPEGRAELKPYYRSGDDRGRIYRIYPKGQACRRIRDLTRLNTADLVAALRSPNGPTRDAAQRLLIERQDPSAVKLLENEARGGDDPRARLHALWTLDGLGALSAGVVGVALRDPHAGVRRQAIRLAEPLAPTNQELLAAAVGLVNDPNAKVRLQLAYALGQWEGDAAAEALARLALRDGDDPFLLAAVFSSINAGNLGDVTRGVLAEMPRPAARRLVGRLLELAVALDDRATVGRALHAVLRAAQPELLEWTFETVADLFDAVERGGTSFEAVLGAETKNASTLHRQIAAIVAQARKVVFDEDAGESLRCTAIRLLARSQDEREDDMLRLAELLSPRTPPVVQIAVVRHLGSRHEASVGELLLSGWFAFSPRLRSETLDILTTRTEWLHALLDAVERGQVALSDIDTNTRQTLRLSQDQSIRARVEALLGNSTQSNRRRVVDEYRPVLKMAGSPGRGAVVFKKACAACHRLDGVGHDIGPNLRSISDRKPSSLLTSILDPSASVDSKYVTYVAVTESGRVFAGMIASETANSIALVGQENKQHVVLRSELEELRSTGKSLMPEGLEKDLSHQDLADLIAYIRADDVADRAVAK